jgi:hypothetical protein
MFHLRTGPGRGADDDQLISAQPAAQRFASLVTVPVITSLFFDEPAPTRAVFGFEARKAPLSPLQRIV